MGPSLGSQCGLPISQEPPKVVCKHLYDFHITVWQREVHSFHEIPWKVSDRKILWITNFTNSICHLPKKNLWAHRCSLLRSIHWSSQRIFSEDLPCMKHGCILQVRGGKGGVHEMKREWGRNIVYLMLYLHNTKEFLYSWTVIYSGKKIFWK